MAIRNEVQRFGSALLITIANTSLLKGEKNFIPRWWKDNKGGSKEYKAQKMCFACSSVSYYIHGNSHVQVEKGLTRSINNLFIMFEKLFMTPKVCEYFLLCMCTLDFT
jgi:hypothetical protein